MDFMIPEELRAIQSTVKDFVTDQLRPLERIVLGRAADLSDTIMYLPLEEEERLIDMVKDMGLWGVSVPEEFGGVGLGTLGSCLVEEEIAQTVVPFNFGDVNPMLFDCNPQQRKKYLTPVFNKQKFPYWALMESGRNGFEDMQTKAEKANGGYVLNGRKISLSPPRAAKDYFAVVFAVTDPEKPLREGVSCFLVDKGISGFSMIGDREKTGWEARERRPMSLVFDQCQVTAESMLGEEGSAFFLGKKWLPLRRIVRGARCVGVAQRILDECTMQAQNWKSFGQLISGRPSIQAALGDIATNIHAARLMVYEAAWRANQGEPIQRLTAMVKLFATQMIHCVADNAAHIFNAPAYTGGLPMERLCRSAGAMSSTEFALQLQRNIIARDLLKGLKV